MLAVLVLSTLLVSTMGYETGPPVLTKVCRDMFPTGHNSTAKPAPAPFDACVTCHCYVPGDQICVNYKVWDGHDPLEGIFLQVRRTAGDTDTAVGVFTVDPKEAMKTLDCNGNTSSAASHNAEVKERSKGGCWTAPSGLGVGKVKFVATALLHQKEFWTFVESQELGPCPAGKFPEDCPTSTIVTDAAFCNGATLHPAGLVTVLSSLLVILTSVISF